MNPSADDPYFVSEVMTAPPQRLRLMLIEGALQFARRASELWTEKRYYEAGDSVDRCRDIITELMACIRRDQQPALTGRITDLYAWMYRTITVAHISHDTQMLGEVISVLEIERDTWQEVCNLLTKGNAADGAPAPASPANQPSTPLDSLGDGWIPSGGDGLCLDA